MPQEHSTSDQSYLTTKEVADILRVKERKVYDLAAAGEIPHRRIIGKLLFPKDELLGWIEAGYGSPSAERPPVVAGSHDPLLGWVVSESESNLATLFNGSRAGLDAFAEGNAALTGLHIPDKTDWNISIVAARELKNAVLIAWASRARGLILSKQARPGIASVGDLKGRRVVLRQPGAGGAVFFDNLLRREGMSLADLEPVGGLAHTEYDAAAAVAAGQADAATGIEAMARQFNLDFLPLTEERFDLLIDRRAYFTPPVQKLLTFARSTACHQKAESIGGYDLGQMGNVRWLSG